MSKKGRYICLLIFLIIAGIIFYNFYSNYVQIKKLESNLRNLQDEIETTRKENEELKVKLKNIDDMEYIEKIAREKLGLVKPGETLLIPVEEGEGKQ
ncbi:MAG: FtsB family cell division protein [Bacillota bacterium]